MDNIIYQRLAVLPLTMDTPTYGGGNCGFHAIVQQLRRFGVTYNHLQLRRLVCQYALGSPDVALLRDNFNAVSTDARAWEELFGSFWVILGVL